MNKIKVISAVLGTLTIIGVLLILGISDGIVFLVDLLKWTLKAIADAFIFVIETFIRLLNFVFGLVS